MINPLLAAAIRHRLYRIEAADLEALQAEAGGRRASSFVALYAHITRKIKVCIFSGNVNQFRPQMVILCKLYLSLMLVNAE